MFRIIKKYSDWLLLLGLCFLAFWILGRPLLARGQIYHDNVRLFALFRDGFNAANHYGEIMLWNPEYTGAGFPAFYLTHLAANTLTPLSVVWLFIAWISGRFGIGMDATVAYQLHIYLVVPMAVSIAFYALARQIVRHPTARAYLIVVTAFSPAVLFNYSDNGPEQTAYGFFAAAAFLKFYRSPSRQTFWVMVLAAAACAAALNHIALYWNVLFVPAFMAVTIFVGAGAISAGIKRAMAAVPLRTWITVILLLASYFAWPARSFLLGSDLMRATLGTRVYATRDLLAGNPVEAFTAGTPGVGFEWQERPNAPPEWAAVTYPGMRFAYTYLGVLTLPLWIVGLVFGRRPWRIRLFALVAAGCLIAPLAGSSGLFSALIDMVYPLRAVNHYSDTMFRNGTSFLILLGAGLAIDAIALARHRAILRWLVVLFLARVGMSGIALFTLYPGKLNVPVVSFFVAIAVLHFAALGRLLIPAASRRSALAALAVLALVDVSTVAGLHCRYVIWPLAEGPWGRLEAGQFSVPRGDSRRQYGDLLLTIGERQRWEQAGYPTADDNLPEFGLFDDVSGKGLGPPAAGSLRPTRQTYNTRVFEAETSREAYVFWRNSFFRGWTASLRSLDGGSATAVAVVRAFGWMTAARIPAGHSEITFRFAPRFFLPLFFWTYISLAGLAVWTCWQLLRRRWRHH